ncbi:unnamed protein product [Cuscuta epithymum]|uniref:Uncharacterized protein n=1 Tax=Cuscuta epithymum TaxID=186058 RepID=A0AAV0DAX0_9ASTE|nr:unnamed protein product [Cuscuta epithymum]
MVAKKTIFFLLFLFAGHYSGSCVLPNNNSSTSDLLWKGGAINEKSKLSSGGFRGIGSRGRGRSSFPRASPALGAGSSSRNSHRNAAAGKNHTPLYTTALLYGATLFVFLA